MALQLASAAQKAGHEVLISAPEDNPYIQNAKAQGFETLILQAPKSLLPIGGTLLKSNILKKLKILLWDLIPYNFKVLKTLKAQNCDVIYMAQERGLLQTALALKLLSKPVIWHVQGGLNDRAGFFHKIAATLSHKIICVSRAVQDDVLHFTKGNHKNKTSILYNGIKDIHQKKNQVKNDTINILFAGNVTPERGVHTLLEASMDLPADKTHITIAGWLLDEPYKHYLEKMIGGYDLQNVELAGYCEDIEKRITNSDIVVCPTIDKGTITINNHTRTFTCKEGFGLTALEAMRASKPVVCSAVFGLKEVVEHDKTGLHVPPDTPKALEDALMTLIQDIKKREVFGQNGRARYLEHFTQDKMESAFLNVLKDMEAEYNA